MDGVWAGRSHAVMPRRPPLDPPAPTALGQWVLSRARERRVLPWPLTRRRTTRLARLLLVFLALYGTCAAILAWWTPFPVACTVGEGAALLGPLLAGMAGGLVTFPVAPLTLLPDGAAVTTRGAAAALLMVPGVLMGWAWAMMALRDRMGERGRSAHRLPVAAILAAALFVPVGEVGMRMGKHGDPGRYVQSAAFGWTPCPASGAWGTGLSGR